ncbi:hypothetical protein ACFQO7_04205 [Catellatospora aurea]|uniref:ABC-2 type transport system permease protein n=1 Tax=Catellatospora aurea TaxID=1337874 RepID=A0ABW2GNV9_9ACTN
MTAIPGPTSPPDPLTRLADGIWVGVPLTLRKLSAGLAMSTVDGLYLAARPVVGLVTVPAVFLTGLVVGVLHPGFEYVFTEALWLLLLIALVGAVSGALGSYLTLGFALGDLALGAHPQWETWRTDTLLGIPAQYGSQLLTYALFAMLAVGVPIAAKSFAAEFLLPPSVPRAVRAMVGLGALVVISGLLVWVWTQSAPLLVRPVFVWAGARPTVEAMSTTQESGGWIVFLAVAATIGRAAAQAVLANPIGKGGGPDRMTQLEDRFRTDVPVQPLAGRIPLVLRLLIRAAILTALLSGLYAAYWQAGLTFLVLFVAQVIASPLLPLDFGAYARFIAKIPRIIRLIVVMIPVYLLGAVVVPMFLDQTSFFPFLLLAIVSAVLMTLLSPHVREAPPAPPTPAAAPGTEEPK